MTESNLEDEDPSSDLITELPCSPPGRIIHARRNRRRPSLASPLYPNSPSFVGEQFDYPEDMTDEPRKVSVFSAPACEAPVMLPKSPIASIVGENKAASVISFRVGAVRAKTLAAIMTMGAAVILAAIATFEFLVNEPNVVFTSLKAVPWTFYAVSVLVIAYGLLFKKIAPIRWTIRIAGYPTCFLAMAVAIISIGFSVIWSVKVLIWEVSYMGDKINKLCSDALAIGWILASSGLTIFIALKFYIEALQKCKMYFRFIERAKLAGLEQLNLENGVVVIPIEMTECSGKTPIHMDVVLEDDVPANVEVKDEEEDMDLAEVHRKPSLL